MAYGHKDSCPHPGHPCTCDTQPLGEAMKVRKWTIWNGSTDHPKIDGDNISWGENVRVVEESAYDDLVAQIKVLKSNLIMQGIDVEADDGPAQNNVQSQPTKRQDLSERDPLPEWCKPGQKVHYYHSLDATEPFIYNSEILSEPWVIGDTLVVKIKGVRGSVSVGCLVPITSQHRAQSAEPNE